MGLVPVINFDDTLKLKRIELCGHIYKNIYIYIYLHTLYIHTHISDTQLSLILVGLLIQGQNIGF